jgi:hypothetical protein
MTWPIWLKQRTVKAIVCQWNVSVNSPMPRVTKPISNPTLIICNAIFPAKIFVGSLAAASLHYLPFKANANPGNPSTKINPQNVSNGKGKPKKEQGKWHRFLRNSLWMYFINFKILSNITRPSFTAIKMVENYHQVEPCHVPWKWLSH